MKTYCFNQVSRPLSLIVFAFLLMRSVTSVQAQDRWSIEIRHGPSQSEKFGGSDLKIGFGFEGMFVYRFRPRFAAYTGWSWNRFQAEQSFAGSNIDFEEKGYLYGVQYFYPIGTSRLQSYWRFGGLWNHVEAVNEEGKVIADSGHRMGFQMEVGLIFPLGKKWQVQPSIRYRELPTEFEIDSEVIEANLAYLSLCIGVAWLL